MAKKKAGGRPTKYKPEFVRLAALFCKLGATDAQLAELFEVNEDTINEWKNVHPEFSESIKEAKFDHDTKEVEAGMLKRAKGFTRTVERVTKDGDVVECQEEMAPDTVAGIFWLSNRNPARWRQKQDVDVSGAINISIKERK